MYEYDKDKNYLYREGFLANASVTRVLNDKTRYIRWRSSDGITSYNGDLLISYDLNATEYVPYNGHAHSITFPSEAGTVYGGTLTLNQDGTGSLVVDKDSYSINSATGFYAHPDGRWYKNSLPSDISSLNRNIFVANSRVYKAQTTSDLVLGAYMAYGSTGLYLNKLSADETLEQLDAMLSTNPLQIVYNKATPVTYTLAPGQVKTLLGVNNIWADTGDILSVDYPADTKLYIDGKIASLQALILENISNT